MYRRISYAKRKERKRRAILLFSCLTAAVAVVGSIGVIKVKTLAAPEDPAVEAAAAMAQQGGALLESEPQNKENTNPDVPLIIVDPGHGGVDTGCSFNEISEKDINLDIAKRVQEKLTQMGYQTLMAREDDTYISKEERVEWANNMQADVYVSIHQNTYEDVGANGIETWYDGGDVSRDSGRLARLVQQETVKSTGAAERELKGDSQLYVTGQTNMAACLVETGFLSNREEREKLVTDEYKDMIAAGIAQAIHLYFNPKTMYLTFDDGPTAENTVAVLDILKKRNIKATFFVVGENVRKNPEVAKRIAAEGHTIGIHCNQHDYDKIYASVDTYVQDFEKARQAVLEITGVDTKLFRFPGGSINDYNKRVAGDIITEMTNRGYIYFDWNACLNDAVNNPEPEELIKNAKESTLGREHVVMLAHDVVYNTGICLEDLLDRLPEYRMELLTEGVKPVQFQ